MTDKVATVLQDRNGVFFEPNETVPFTGTFITKYENNEQKQEEVNYKNGKKDGLETSWFENGQKQYEAGYKDGVQDGLEIYWFENGQKQSEAGYKDGKTSRLSITWDENGRRKNQETNYKNGVFVDNLSGEN